jgi:hypothetical protein
MITTAEAAALRTSFILQMPARIEAAIRAAAQSGASSVVFAYAPASDAQAQAFATSTLIPAGWASTTVNTTNQTITIAP